MKPENRVAFKSRADAVVSGYRACKVCKPDTPPDGQPWRSVRRISHTG
jgi:methylphosphotriester-DNA--protein-cysteine methyltransferase